MPEKDRCPKCGEMKNRKATICNRCYGRGIPLAERFWKHVNRRTEGECWPWEGFRDEHGYGHFRVNEKAVGAHIVSYRLATGDIPEGLFVCHHCDNPACVNPSHLFLGTQSDNVQDALRKGRMATGVRVGTSRMNPAMVVEIRRKYAEGGISQAALGRMYGVGHTTVGAVVLRTSWKDVG